MTDFAIDPLTGDLDIESGDLNIASELEEIRQRLTLKLGMVAGEWFYNRNRGVDYYARVLGKKGLDPVSLDAVFVTAITTTEGVIKLLEPINYELDVQKRILQLSFQALTESGTLEMGITV